MSPVAACIRTESGVTYEYMHSGNFATGSVFVTTYRLLFVELPPADNEVGVNISSYIFLAGVSRLDMHGRQ